MQESKDVLNYEKMHSIDKRRAAIDSRYRAFVTNKAFTDYFEYEHFYTITDFVHPDEVGRLKKFIDEFAGDTQEQVFRFRFKDGSYRYNLLRLLCKKTGMDGGDNIDIEMIDVQSIEAVIEHLTSDVSRLRMFLGMTQEYAFSYNRSDNIICIFRYEQYQKVIIYKMDIDEWKQEMIDKSYIDPEEYSLFVTMVSDIKSYVQSFTIKMNSCLRTQSNIMERLCFCGNLFNGAGHERMMVGRIIPEDTIAQQKAIEVIDELHRKSYEESITRVQHVGTNGREIQELKAIAKFMSDVTENQALAYREILQHMLESYQLDTINIYYGENLSRVYTVGFEQNYSDNAQYVKTQEFKQLLEEKDYMETSFVAGMFNSAPQFCAAMKQKRVFSTIQCIIGTPDDIKGLVTFDKCKESGTWADYQIDCARIFASFLSMQAMGIRKK